MAILNEEGDLDPGGAIRVHVASRRLWRTIDERLSYFESEWKPKSRGSRYRFVFIRKRVHRQNML